MITEDIQMRKIISALVALILLVCFAAFGEEEITVIVW